MRNPGFTADSSLYRSSGHYRSQGRPGARSGLASVLPQQDNGEPGVCCGQYCPGLCSCQHGHVYCSPVTRGPERVMATNAVLPMLDACHSTQPIHHPDGSVSYQYVTCPYGCWATAHDAGCFHY